MRTAACLILLALAGCSMLTPGLDTRTAAQANARTVWGADDSLTLEEDTTHNRRVVAAEAATGAGLEMEYYPDGTPKTVKGASHHLSQCSEPEDAMKAYTKLAERNAEVAANMMATMQSMATIITPLIQQEIELRRARAEAAAAPPKGWERIGQEAGSEGLAMLVDLLRKAQGLPPRTATQPASQEPYGPPATQPSREPTIEDLIRWGMP